MIDQFSFPIDVTCSLVGPTVVLRPVCAEDFEPLYEAAADPLIWEQHPDRQRYQREPFRQRFFDGALASGSAYVVVDQESGKLVGSSRFYEWNLEAREVAIGYTFLSRSHWGGVTNGEMKQLMLDHAFTWAQVVWFHIGRDNWRSRKATEKVGAVFSHEAPKELSGILVDYTFYRIDADKYRKGS